MCRLCVVCFYSNFRSQSKILYYFNCVMMEKENNGRLRVVGKFFFFDRIFFLQFASPLSSLVGAASLAKIMKLELETRNNFFFFLRWGMRDTSTRAGNVNGTTFSNSFYFFVNETLHRCSISWGGREEVSLTRNYGATIGVELAIEGVLNRE